MSDFRVESVSNSNAGSTITPSGKCVIRVLGIGGGGGNSLQHMINDSLSGVEFIAVNTDSQALSKSTSPLKVQIGVKLTNGLGAGCDPNKGRKAAEESKEDIKKLIQGSDMVFITAGMGGGTGTGAAPIIAEIAKETGALTVAVVTKPFKFEGKKRSTLAEQGIARLSENVDSLIVIPNDRLKLLSDRCKTLSEAFLVADEVLSQGVKSISELIKVPGFVNLDFADVCSVMRDAGYAHMGVGTAKGKDKSLQAADMATSSPLLETSIAGAKGVIISITSSPDIGLEEIENACESIKQKAHPDANITWGVAFDSKLEDEIIITVIATGFDAKPSEDFGSIPTFKSTSNAGAPIRSTAAASENAPIEPPDVNSSKPQAKSGVDDEDFYVILNDIIKKKGDNN